ncbi:hypothetical protein WG901_21375 [Novosphingobium sp. PS1R-30]|uniref:Transcriptional regulator n=1 Tax=Novosphingobium anseongense TaxID=3133436 RepID=A0ABU8S1Y5_9SPHN
MTSITQNLHALGLVSTRARTRTLLDPALVEAAFAHLDRVLTRDEQEIILRAVGDRSKVNWPDWWQIR